MPPGHAVRPRSGAGFRSAPRSTAWRNGSAHVAGQQFGLFRKSRCPANIGCRYVRFKGRDDARFCASVSCTARRRAAPAHSNGAPKTRTPWLANNEGRPAVRTGAQGSVAGQGFASVARQDFLPRHHDRHACASLRPSRIHRCRQRSTVMARNSTFRIRYAPRACTERFELNALPFVQSSV